MRVIKSALIGALVWLVLVVSFVGYKVETYKSEPIPVTTTTTLPTDIGSPLVIERV